MCRRDNATEALAEAKKIQSGRKGGGKGGGGRPDMAQAGGPDGAAAGAAIAAIEGVIAERA